MIAYNKLWLDHLHLRYELEDAHKKNFISGDELSTCKEKYPVGFYTPNFFVRIGLFILAVVISLFTCALIALMSGISGNEGFTALLIIFGLTNYAALEFMVNAKHHYKSGVDDALIWMTAVFLVSAFNLSGNTSSLQNALLVFIISFYLSLRFTNMIMSAISYFAFLAIIFFGYTRLGTTAKATVPFLIIIISAFMYFLVIKNKVEKRWKHYAGCLLMIEIVSLLCVYVAGNYYVVREASISMFQLDLKEHESIPFGWLFWIFTILIPFTYLATGLQKKNEVMIRIGLILIAAAIFTLRYYYQILPIETAMIIGGIILIVLAYALIKYLREPKHGFTDKETGKDHLSKALRLESLVIAQTFGQTKIGPAGDQTTLGGGSGGGGGAGGEF